MKSRRTDYVHSHRPLMEWILSVLLVLSVIGSGTKSPAQGIPEPDIVLYGAIKNAYDNSLVSSGTLTWSFQPVGGGPTVTASTSLTNIANQLSYILRIPCETPVSGFSTSSNTVDLNATGTLYNRSQVALYSNRLDFVLPGLTNTTISSADRGRLERVDLTLNVTPVLPTDWQLLYFGHTGVDPFADPDGDGMSNWQEYLAGTNPTNAASVLKFTSVSSNPQGITLDWLSVQNKSYVLERSSDISTGFMDVSLSITATPPINSVQDTNAIGPGPFFYRLRVGP